MLSVFTEMLGCWVVPFKNYVRQFHPISKMATTGEHSLTWTLCEIISKIFSSETTRPIETKRGHNGPYVVPCKIVSDILTLHLRWRYWGHNLKLDFFLNSYSQKFVIKVFEVSIQAHIMLYVSQFGN
jgi:hypothetical protein